MNPSYGIFGAPVNFAHAAATHQAYHPASPTTQAYYSSPTVGPTQGSPQRKTNDPYAASVTPPLAVEAAAGAGGMGGSTGTPSNLSFDASHLLSSMTPPASPLLTGGSQTAAQVAHQQQQQQAYASGDASGLQWGALAGNGASHSTAVPLQNISHDALLAAAIQVQHQQQQLAMLSAAAGFGPHPNPLQQQLLANALLMQSGGGHMQAAPQDPNHLMMLMLMHQQQQATAVAQLQQHHQLQQQQQSHHFQHHSQQQQHVAVGSRASHGAGGNAYDDLDGQRGGANNAAPTLEALRGMSGSLCDVARTANGSSMIQNAIKERGTGPEGGQALQFILQELYPQLGDLLLDSHGCYVVKTLIDHLPAPQLQQLLGDIAADEPLAFSLCTHSLHTRRVVQHVMEQYDGHFLIDLLTRRCAEVAMTQQGCIVMQRAMDRAVGPQRDALYAAIHKNFLHFCRDAFANYVVQHLLEVGNRESNSTVVSAALQGRVVELSCNKFASNVVEKCLFHVTAEVQHQILVEMYTSGEQTLNHMLQDSFGNYIIQSSIALATFRDVWFINEHLRPVLRLTPYGHKIEARLDRRMKGKTVQARQHLGAAEGGTEVVERPSAAAATSGPAGPFQGGRGASRGGRGGAPGGRAGGGRGGRGAHSAAADPVNAPMVPSNEEPW